MDAQYIDLADIMHNDSPGRLDSAFYKNACNAICKKILACESW